MHEGHFQLPIKDPVLIFTIVMLILLVAPLVTGRLRIPSVIGLIAAGALVGPNALGLLARDQTIVLLGTVGIIYLMFMAGLEIDMVEFNRAKHRSMVFGVLTFAIPQAVGTALGLALGYSTLGAILLASMFASHTLLAYPIASRLRIASNSAVITAVGGTIVTDVAALLVLAVIAGAARGELDAAFWTRLGVSLTIYVAVVVILVPRLGRRFFARANAEGTADFIFVMAVLFACAFLAELAGVEAIIGAFLAGLALNRLIPHQGTLSNRVHFVGTALFVPFFLLSVGMLVDVRGLFVEAWVWVVAISMTVAVLVTKLLAAKLTQLIFRYSPAQGWAIYGLSVPQAAATLAATLIGFDLGLFDQATVNGVIMMILVTCIVGPLVVERFGPQVALQEEARPQSAREAPRRTLVPIVEGQDNATMLELAILLRDHDSHEPIFPTTVVQDEGDTGSRVARAEKLLAEAVTHGSGADVATVPLTRVARNPAVGMTRAVIEQRISDVVVGWDAQPGAPRSTFGRMIDPLLAAEHLSVLVVHLKQPLSATKRLVVLLPPLIDRNPGFADAVRLAKTLGSRLGVMVTVAGMERDGARIRSAFDATKPDVELSFAPFGGHREMLRSITDRLEPSDLVLLVNARRGTLAFTEELEHLPRGLGALLPCGFAVLYPPEREALLEPGAEATALLFESARTFVQLPRMTASEALAQAVDGAFGGDPARVSRIRAALDPSGSLPSSEVLPGLRLLHTQVEGLGQEQLLICISPGGFELSPPVARETHALFVLLTPASQPLAEHLARVGEIERRLGQISRPEVLIAARRPEEVVRRLAGAATPELSIAT